MLHAGMPAPQVKLQYGKGQAVKLAKLSDQSADELSFDVKLEGDDRSGRGSGSERQVRQLRGRPSH